MGNQKVILSIVPWGLEAAGEVCGSKGQYHGDLPVSLCCPILDKHLDSDVMVLSFPK